MPYTKQNDNYDKVYYRATTRSGEVIDLTDANVQFKMESRKGELLVNSPGTILNATNGEMEYQLQDVDTTKEGLHRAEFTVTFSDGKEKTFPEDGYIQVNITGDIDTNRDIETIEKIAIEVTLIEDFKAEIQAEEDVRVANENERMSNETIRQSNEITRQNSENNRESAETTRNTNEDSRISAENTRETNESDRINTENTRQSNEQTRQSQEVDRQTNTSNAIDNLNSEVNNLKLNYLTPVATFADIATTYTSPNVGDIVQTEDNMMFYRWSGVEWKWNQTYSNNAVTDAQNKIQEHKIETMPHQVKDLDLAKTYRYGLQIKDGVTQFIYEEVL